MDASVKAPTPANSEKAKALQVALAQIEKQFGKGTIMRLGEGEVIEDIQVVSTGSLGLDIALGVGGLFDYYSGRIPRAPVWMRPSRWSPTPGNWCPPAWQFTWKTRALPR